MEILDNPYFTNKLIHYGSRVGSLGALLKEQVPDANFLSSPLIYVLYEM